MSSSCSAIPRTAKAVHFSPLLSPWPSRLRVQLPELRQRRPAVLRAVISREDNSVSTLRPPAPADLTGATAAAAGDIEVRVVLTVRNKIKERLSDKIEGEWESFINGIGQGITVQLVGEDIDREAESGKKSAKIAVRGWLPKPANHSCLTEYAASFSVSSDFGRPGAVIITNLHSKEFFLTELVVHGFADGPFFFPVYVPRDENFEEIKQETFSSGSVRALFHNLVPALVAQSYGLHLANTLPLTLVSIPSEASCRIDPL